MDGESEWNALSRFVHRPTFSYNVDYFCMSIDISLNRLNKMLASDSPSTVNSISISSYHNIRVPDVWGSTLRLLWIVVSLKLLVLVAPVNSIIVTSAPEFTWLHLYCRHSDVTQ